MRFTVPVLLLSLFLVSCSRADGVSADALQPEQIPATTEVSEILAEAASGSTDALYALGENGGEGAWFALSTAAAQAGYPELAEILLIRSAQEDKSIFGRISLERVLIENPGALKRPLHAIRKAEELGARANESLAGLRAARISVLVSTGAEKALVRELEEVSGGREDAPVLAAALGSRNASTREKAEALLPGYIARIDDPELMRYFPKLENPQLDSLRKARKAFSDGDFVLAMDEFQVWLTGGKTLSGLEIPPQSEPSPVFTEIADSAKSVGKLRDGAEMLATASSRVQGPDRFAALYESGRLYKEIGDSAAAGSAFAEAADAVPGGLLRDRAIWQKLGVDTSASTAESQYESFVWSLQRWDNPDRFADHLDEYVHRLVGLGEWTILERFFREWNERWPDTVRARTALILAWAEQEHNLESDFSVRELLEFAAEQSPLSWAGLRSAALLGRDIVLPSGTEDRSSGSGGPASVDDRIIELFLQWGLLMPSYERVLDEPRLYSESTIRALSSALARNDRPRLSIRIIGLLLGRDDYQPGIEDLRLRYPLPLGDLARAAAEVYGVPPEIFFGLIRTESAWDREAVSRSGARGLAQFMPATWEEWIRRLHYPEDTSPNDPVVNLTLAAAYLEWLYEREWTSGWSEVLVAYNAGGGRLRSWRQERAGFGNHLFVESVPLEEPRSYVRKVLSAATLYGYLYADLSPAEMHRFWGLSDLSDSSLSEE